MTPFPPPLDSYPPVTGGLLLALVERATLVPFNAVATAIFALAIVHTLTAGRFLAVSRAIQRRHDEREQAAGRPPSPRIPGELCAFLGEVEVVFGLWAVVLVAAITWRYGWTTAKDYLDHTVDYTDALFVFVIMALASTRPIVTLAEGTLRRVARLGGGTPAAWWLA